MTDFLTLAADAEAIAKRLGKTTKGRAMLMQAAAALREAAPIVDAAYALAKGREYSVSLISDGPAYDPALKAVRSMCCPICSGVDPTAPNLNQWPPDSAGHEAWCPMPKLVKP